MAPYKAAAGNGGPASMADCGSRSCAGAESGKRGGRSPGRGPPGRGRGIPGPAASRGGPAAGSGGISGGSAGRTSSPGGATAAGPATPRTGARRRRPPGRSRGICPKRGKQSKTGTPWRSILPAGMRNGFGIARTRSRVSRLNIAPRIRAQLESIACWHCDATIVVYYHSGYRGMRGRCPGCKVDFPLE